MAVELRAKAVCTEPRTVHQTQRLARFYDQVNSPFTLLFMVLIGDCCQLSWLQWQILTQHAADPEVKHLFSKNDLIIRTILSKQQRMKGRVKCRGQSAGKLHCCCKRDIKLCSPCVVIDNETGCENNKEIKERARQGGGGEERMRQGTAIIDGSDSARAETWSFVWKRGSERKTRWYTDRAVCRWSWRPARLSMRGPIYHCGCWPCHWWRHEAQGSRLESRAGISTMVGDSNLCNLVKH